MIDYITRNIREYFTGKDTAYIFKKAFNIKHSNITAIDMYVHIPFCKNICPYCPYFKVEYNEQKISLYLKAILSEIDMYQKLFGKITISSIYIGGGSPALLIDELFLILKRINANFNVIGKICIELNPNDVTEQLISKLKDNNINLVSLGAQSFLDKHLNFIGRKYQGRSVTNALEQLVKAEFESVNIDLLFSLPKQTTTDIDYDLKMAIQSGVNQITTYPLFTFPYTSIGEYLKIKKVKMPSIFKRRKQYYFLHKYLNDKAFNRVSVWGFKKGDVPKYSSVTRQQYLGLGAGSGSHLSDGFYLNTFSIDDYISCCMSNKMSTALYMEFTEDMQKYFWLYWRFYDTYIQKSELLDKFGLNDKKLNNLFEKLKMLKCLKENDTNYNLTMRGAFWIHLAQNFFSLRYINKIWGKAIHEPYPSAIEL